MHVPELPGATQSEVSRAPQSMLFLHSYYEFVQKPIHDEAASPRCSFAGKRTPHHEFVGWHQAALLALALMLPLAAWDEIE